MYKKEKIRFLPDPDIKVRTMTYDIVPGPSFDYATLYPNVMMNIDIRILTRKIKLKNILEKINPSN
jgi:hypothetical protein